MFPFRTVERRRSSFLVAHVEYLFNGWFIRSKVILIIRSLGLYIAYKDAYPIVIDADWGIALFVEWTEKFLFSKTQKSKSFFTPKVSLRVSEYFSNFFLDYSEKILQSHLGSNRQVCFHSTILLKTWVEYWKFEIFIIKLYVSTFSLPF